MRSRIARFTPSLAAAVALLAAAPFARAQAPAEPAPQPPQAAPPAPAYAPPPASAQPPRRDIGFLLRLGFDFGGDKVATVTMSDGSTQTVKAGQLVTIGGGLIYHPVTAPYAVEATIAWKGDSVNASNGSISFSRIPIDLIASYANGRHRIGAGPTMHLSPKYSCDVTGISCGSDVTFDSAPGGIVQYAYGVPVGRIGLEAAVRGTFIKYKKSGYPTLDGSSFGVHFGAWF